MLAHRLRAAAGNAGGDGIPADGLIAHYTMDNISGSTLVDEQGSYDGTLYSTDTMAGKFGNAVTTSGATNSFIDVSALPDDPSTLAVSMWIYISALPASYYRFFGHRNDATTLALLDIQSTGAIRMLARTSSQSIRQPEGGSINVGAWNHIYAHFSKTDGLLCYLNGGSIVSDATDIIGSIDSGITMLGNNSTNTSLTGEAASFDGGIEQVRIYNRALTVDEITALYNEV